MNRFFQAIAPMILAVAAGPALAADWWLVSGAPDGRAAVFADVDTRAHHDDGVGVRVLRIDRAGRSAESFEHVACGGGSGDDALRRFACASDRDRERLGIILAGMSPAQVARMIFAIGATQTPADRSGPRG